MRGAVARMLVTVVGAGLMLAGGIVLLARPTIPLGPDGSAYVGFADGTTASPAVPAATTLLIVGFVVVAAMAVVGVVVAARTRTIR